MGRRITGVVIALVALVGGVALDLWLLASAIKNIYDALIEKSGSGDLVTGIFQFLVCGVGSVLALIGIIAGGVLAFTGKSFARYRAAKRNDSYSYSPLGYQPPKFPKDWV